MVLHEEGFGFFATVTGFFCDGAMLEGFCCDGDFQRVYCDGSEGFFATARDVFCDGEPIVRVFCDGKWCFSRRWRGFLRRAAERQALRHRRLLLRIIIILLLLLLLAVGVAMPVSPLPVAKTPATDAKNTTSHRKKPSLLVHRRKKHP
jgi:hypothetical protein